MNMEFLRSCMHNPLMFLLQHSQWYQLQNLHHNLYNIQILTIMIFILYFHPHMIYINKHMDLIQQEHQNECLDIHEVILSSLVIKLIQFRFQRMGSSLMKFINHDQQPSRLFYFFYVSYYILYYMLPFNIVISIQIDSILILSKTRVPLLNKFS